MRSARSLSPVRLMRNRAAWVTFDTMNAVAKKLGREGAIDIAITAALALTGLIEVWATSAFDDDPRGLVAVVVVAMIAPLRTNGGPRE